MSDKETHDLRNAQQVLLGRLEVLTASVNELHRELGALKRQMPDLEWCPLCTHPLYDERKELVWSCRRQHTWHYQPSEEPEDECI